MLRQERLLLDGRLAMGAPTPASTVATWRSLRSNGSDLWAKFQTSAESRRSIMATVRDLPPAP